MISDYSIVITIYNDEKEIVELLNNIKEQTVQPKEIIIVDGGSSDKSIEYVENYSANIKLIRGGRLNISEGLNRGIRECISEYVGIAMTGNRYKRDFFEILLNVMKTSDCGIAYGPICGNSAGKFSDWYNKYLLNGDEGKDFGIASNHGCLLKREVFNEIGFFYEKFVYAGEDAEFYARALKNGIKCKFVEQAKLYWDTPNSLKAYLKQKKVYTIADMQICREEFLKKHFLSSVIVFATCALSVFLGGIKWYLFFLPLPIFFILTIIMYNVLKGYSIVQIFLYLGETFLPVIYMLVNVKYLRNQYQVEDTNTRKRNEKD